MPNYATLNTARYELGYTNNQFSHIMRFRFEREQGAAPTGAQLEQIGAFMNALVPICATDYSLDSAVWYPADSRVSLPAVAANIEASVPGTNTPGGAARAYQINFQGKSLTGAKASMMLIGVTGSAVNALGTNYRITLAEGSTWLPAALAALRAISGLVAIDNSSVIWYDYVNIKPHDYWAKAVR